MPHIEYAHAFVVLLFWLGCAMLPIRFMQSLCPYSSDWWQKHWGKCNRMIAPVPAKSLPKHMSTIPWQTSKCRQLVQTCSSVQKCYPYVFESVHLIGLSMLILEQKSYMMPRKKINAFITDAETDVLFSRDPQRFMRKCKRLGVMDTYLTVINDNFS